MSEIHADLIVRYGRIEIHLDLPRWAVDEMERIRNSGATWGVSTMSILSGGSLQSRATYVLVLGAANTAQANAPSADASTHEEG